MVGQNKEVYLYVAEDATYAVGSQRCFKASDFIGCAASGTGATIFKFKELDTWDSNDAFDSFTLNHTADAQVEVIQTVLGLMSNPHGGYVVVHDFGASTSIEHLIPAIKSTGTKVTFTGAPVVVSTEA